MNRSGLLAVVCLALAGALASCQTPPPSPPPRPARPAVAASAPKGAANDNQFSACADRLQEISGQLLLYYHLHRELPESLDKLGPGAASLLNCPSSNKPYVYNRDGLLVPGWTGRLIVYDAKPYHYGTQWGILAEPSPPGRPVELRVVQFTMRQGQPVICSEKNAPAAPGRGGAGPNPGRR